MISQLISFHPLYINRAIRKCLTASNTLEKGILKQVSNTMLTYFAQLLDGVEVAHLQKVIHRDLIPICVLMDKFEWQQMHANAE